MWFGVMVMAYSLLFTSVLGQIINSYPNKKLLQYGYVEQIKDIFPGVAVAILMGIFVYFFNFLLCAEWVKLIIQIFAGIIFYILVLSLFKLESFFYIKNIIK